MSAITAWESTLGILHRTTTSAGFRHGSQQRHGCGNRLVMHGGPRGAPVAAASRSAAVWHPLCADGGKRRLEKGQAATLLALIHSSSHSQCMSAGGHDGTNCMPQKCQLCAPACLPPPQQAPCLSIQREILLSCVLERHCHCSIAGIVDCGLSLESRLKLRCHFSLARARALACRATGRGRQGLSMPVEACQPSAGANQPQGARQCAGLRQAQSNPGASAV